MLRRDPGVNGDLRHKLLQFLVCHIVDDTSLRSLGAFGQNADLPGNGGCGDLVVAGDHNGTDAGGNALGHSGLGLLPGRIHHGDQAQEAQVVLVLQADSRRIHPAAGKGQHTQPLLGELFVDPLDLGPLRRSHPGALHQHIHSALGHQRQATGKLVHGAHELAV